jgi:hypothetical protein
VQASVRRVRIRKHLLSAICYLPSISLMPVKDRRPISPEEDRSDAACSGDIEIDGGYLISDI